MAIGDKAQRFGIGLGVMLVIAIVGFSLYQSFTGKSQIGQTFVFGFLGLVALGLVRIFIASGEKTLSAEDFILLVLLIGGPLTVLFLLPKLGINLFSSAAPLIGASGNFDINFALTGTAIDWIKGNLGLFMAGVIGLFIYWRKKYGR